MTKEKNIVKVTKDELMKVIMNVEDDPNVPFVGVKMRTLYTDVLKKCKEDGSINPYFKSIYKISSRSYRLVTDYEKRVHTNLIKEGKDPSTFKVESPKGKRHISKSLLIDTETETKNYLMIEWFPENKSTTEYEYNNNPIDKNLFEKWISKSESSNQKQGLDREVTPITVNLSNILEISINGTKYIME